MILRLLSSMVELGDSPEVASRRIAALKVSRESMLDALRQVRADPSSGLGTHYEPGPRKYWKMGSEPDTLAMKALRTAMANKVDRPALGARTSRASAVTARAGRNVAAGRGFLDSFSKKIQRPTILLELLQKLIQMGAKRN